MAAALASCLAGLLSVYVYVFLPYRLLGEVLPPRFRACHGSVSAMWQAACHGLAGIRLQMATDGYAGSGRYMTKTCRIRKFLSCSKKNLQIGASDEQPDGL